MKIARFVLGAVAADGGTVVCRVALDDGSEMDLGVDARIPKQKKDRLVFVGAGYPTLPGARLLARWSHEESTIIEAVRTYADSHRSEQEVLMLLRAIEDR